MVPDRGIAGYEHDEALLLGQVLGVDVVDQPDVVGRGGLGDRQGLVHQRAVAGQARHHDVRVLADVEPGARIPGRVVQRLPGGDLAGRVRAGEVEADPVAG